MPRLASYRGPQTVHSVFALDVARRPAESYSNCSMLQLSGKFEGTAADLNECIIKAALDEHIFLVFLDGLCTEQAVLNVVNVSTILHRAGRLRLRLPDHIIEYLVATLYETHCRNEDLKARQVASALFGLQCLGDTEQSRRLVVALTPKVFQCKEVLKSQEIGQALWGLQGLKDSEEVKELLVALTLNIRRCREVLGSQTVLNALRGVESMGSSKEVRDLLAALAPKIIESPDSMDEQAVGKAICRFKSVGNAPEVQMIVATLSAKVCHRDSADCRVSILKSSEVERRRGPGRRVVGRSSAAGRT